MCWQLNNLNQRYPGYNNLLIQKRYQNHIVYRLKLKGCTESVSLVSNEKGNLLP
jgi:hypothetical protein